MELSRRTVLTNLGSITIAGISKDALMQDCSDLAKALPKRAGRLILAP
jgi:hypothetical protein